MAKFKTIAAWALLSSFFFVCAFGTPIVMAIDGEIDEAIRTALVILGVLAFVAAVTWAAWHLLGKLP